MSKLHELLAVEPDLQNVFKVVTEEAKKTFKDKQNMFLGWTRRLEMFNEEDNQIGMEPEHQKMNETVAKKLNYVGDNGAKFINAVYQKEATNQKAVADLIIDGQVIATSVPATFLLGLETKLKNLHAMYAALPTLAVGVEWQWDDKVNAFRAVHPEIKMKTAKTFQHKVLYDATDKHPAQIEKWEEVINVGKYIRDTWCGGVTTAQKSRMLGRLESAMRGVKKARMRANDIEVVEHNDIGNKLFDYIHNMEKL